MASSSSRLDPNQGIQPADLGEAFRDIESAWRGGTRVVPLFGSGISIDAGIPGTAQIIPYLAKVIALIDHRCALEDPPPDASNHYSAYLTLHGWPDTHFINTELLKARRQAAVKKAKQSKSDDGKRGSDHRAAERDDFHLLSQEVDDVIFREFRSTQSSLVSHFVEHYAKSRSDEALTDLKRYIRSDWRTLLRRATDGRQGLIDSFFDHLIRQSRPSPSHQFVAFLTRLIGWPLILTTNFDSLIEQALREQQIEPAVFELPEHGPVPDSALISDNFSVVKLHGGRFGLRVGESLDAPLDEESIGRFLQYLPRKRLLLVIGYGGGDRRVMSLVHAIANPKRYANVKDGHSEVIWVYRDKIPEQLKAIASGDKAKVRAVRYRDGGLFLQELYNRLTTAHPASSTSYQTLVAVPPPDSLPPDTQENAGNSSGNAAPATDTSAEQTKTEADGKGAPGSWETWDNQCPDTVDSASMVVFHRRKHGAGTSSQLAAYTRRFRRSHQVIWCDLEEVPSVDTLVAFLLQEFRAYDPQLSPVVLTRPTRWDDGDGQSIQSLHQHRRTPRVARIVEALQRGRYVVALDSTGEYGRTCIDHDVSQVARRNKVEEHSYVDPSRLRDRVEELYEFLLELSEHANEFGESKLAVAHTHVDLLPILTDEGYVSSEDDQGKLVDKSRKLNSLSVQFQKKLDAKVQVDSNKGAVQLHPVVLDHYVAPFTREKAWQAVEASLLIDEVNASELFSDIEGAENLRDALRMLWRDGLKPEYKVLLVVASAFRRPRNIVAMRRIGALALHEFRRSKKVKRTPDQVGNFDPLPLEKLTRLAYRKQNDIDEEDYIQVDKMLAELSKANLLVEQEGGNYWMHRAIRDSIYRNATNDSQDPENRGKCLRLAMSNLHDLVATYYYHDLYRSSNDMHAYFEYVFQRLASLHGADSDQFFTRLRAFQSAIKRDRVILRSRGHSSTMLGWMRSVYQIAFPGLREYARRLFENDEASFEKAEAIIQSLEGILKDLEAEVLLEAMQFVDCMELLLDRIARNHRALVDEELIPTEAESLPTEEWFTQIQHGVRQSLCAIGGSHCDYEPTHRGSFDKVVKELQQVVDVLVEAERSSDRKTFESQDARKLIEDVVEIAVCIKGLRQEMLARELLQKVGDTMAVLAEELGGNDSAKTRDWALLVRLRTCFRLLDANLSEINPWAKLDNRSKQERLEKAQEAYDDGQNVLLQYPGWAETNQYGRYSCYLNSLIARRYYLGNDFTHAYMFLENARANVFSGSGDNDLVALAVSQLRHAECLILHAHDKLVRVAGSNDPKELTNARTAAETRLNSAEETLKQARQVLIQRRRNIWWWALLFLLEAQLRHEQFALTLVNVRDESESEKDQPSQAEPQVKTQSERPERIRHRQDQFLLHGLHSICAGLDNIASDVTRWQQFETLWWQLYLCDLVREGHAATFDERWKHWETLNKQTGLTWFFQQQDSRLEKNSAKWEAAFRLASTDGANRTFRDLLLSIQEKFFPLDSDPVPLPAKSRRRAKTTKSTKKKTTKKTTTKASRRTATS